jgi:hypothetical protein
MGGSYDEVLQGAVFVVRDFFNVDECHKHIETSEECGFRPATLSMGTKNKVSATTAAMEVSDHLLYAHNLLDHFRSTIF